MNSGKGEIELFMAADIEHTDDRLNPPLRYRLDMDKVVQLLTPANIYSGKPGSIYHIETAHNKKGAELYFSEDRLQADRMGVHINAYLHENPFQVSQPKGKVQEHVQIMADDTGLVTLVSVETDQGYIEIYPVDNTLLISQFDLNNPPVSMFQHMLQEFMEGQQIPYRVVPEYRYAVSALEPEQYARIRGFVEESLQYLVPAVNMRAKSHWQSIPGNMPPETSIR